MKDASAHPGQIEQWWSKWPDANIGIATGKDSGLMVLDLDNKDDRRGGDNLALLSCRSWWPATNPYGNDW